MGHSLLGSNRVKDKGCRSAGKPEPMVLIDKDFKAEFDGHFWTVKYH